MLGRECDWFGLGKMGSRWRGGFKDPIYHMSCLSTPFGVSYPILCQDVVPKLPRHEGRNEYPARKDVG